MNETILDKINKLKDEINKHNNLYYREASPIISDYEYDIMMAELITLEKQNPEYKTLDSPTQRVGNDLSEGFEKVKHSWPMLSIDNSYSYDDLKAFDEKVRKVDSNFSGYLAELKLDGASISLHYDNGILTKAVTRGNGVEGDDIYNNIKTLNNIPLKIEDNNLPSHIEIRGEIIMERRELDRLNKIREKNGEKLLANPRNAVAGSIKQLDPNEFKKRRVTVVPFDIYPQYDTRFNILNKLNDWGFSINHHYQLCKDIDEVIEYCKKWDKHRKQLPYDTDGVVVKINEIKLCEKMGMTGHAPRFMVAYKYPPEVVKTKLLGVTNQVGHTGIITPVAELEPVKLCGTTVKRASLYNFERLEENDFRIGDVVHLQKAGEIIPQVIGRDSAPEEQRSKKIEIPTECPNCGSDVYKDGAFLKCNNSNCSAQILGTIENFASKECMNIFGLGEAVIKQLLDGKYISKVEDLYKLDYTKIVSLDRMGEKKVENLKKSLEESKNQPFERVLHALCIPNVGKHLSPILAKQYKNIDNLSKATVSDLQNIKDVGPTVANDIVEWFKNESNKTTINELKQIGLNFEYKETKIMSDNDQPLKGKRFAATGKLFNFTRTGIFDTIQEYGGRTASSIAKDVDYLIAGENAGSKIEKANKLGIKIITESEFMEMIG